MYLMSMCMHVFHCPPVNLIVVASVDVLVWDVMIKGILVGVSCMHMDGAHVGSSDGQFVLSSDLQNEPPWINCKRQTCHI